MTSVAARVATTGALALIGLFVVKFVFGLLGLALGFTAFVLFKLLPVVLIVAALIWVFKKVKRAGSPA